MGLTGSFQFGGIQQSYKFAHQRTGQVVMALSRRQFPDTPCEMVWFKADPDNASDVFLGGNDVSSLVGIELTAGDVWGPIPIDNLNLYWYVGNNTTDRLQYQIVW